MAHPNHTRVKIEQRTNLCELTAQGVRFWSYLRPVGQRQSLRFSFGTGLAPVSVMRLSGWFAAALVLGGSFTPGAAEADEPFVAGQTWSLEVGFGGGWPDESTPYTRTLETFGFENGYSCCEARPVSRFRFSAAVETILLPYFSVLLQTNLLERRKLYRDSGIGPDDVFTWSSWTLDVHARAFLPVREWFRAYIQFGVGPTFSGSRLYVRTTASSDQTRYREVDVGFNVAGLGGLEVTSKHFGFYVQGGYFYSPSPKNLLGDRHQSGGGLLMAGLSTHFGRPR
jgi:hypothetical protein